MPQLSGKKEKQLVFAVGQEDNGGAVFLLVGIPRGCWEEMKKGKSNTVDFTKLGMPLKMTVFGGKTHKRVKETIAQINANLGKAYVDETRKDFGIEEARPTPEQEQEFSEREVLMEIAAGKLSAEEAKKAAQDILNKGGFDYT